MRIRFFCDNCGVEVVLKDAQRCYREKHSVRFVTEGYFEEFDETKPLDFAKSPR